MYAIYDYIKPYFWRFLCSAEEIPRKIFTEITLNKKLYLRDKSQAHKILKRDKFLYFKIYSSSKNKRIKFAISSRLVSNTRYKLQVRIVLFVLWKRSLTLLYKRRSVIELS